MSSCCLSCSKLDDDKLDTRADIERVRDEDVRRRVGNGSSGVGNDNVRVNGEQAQEGRNNFRGKHSNQGREGNETARLLDNCMKSDPIKAKASNNIAHLEDGILVNGNGMVRKHVSKKVRNY